jgi:hypothetical protein
MDIMHFEEKLKIAFHELENSGIKKSKYKPPIYRLAWLLGFKLRPPHYRSFISNLIFSGCWFGTIWGLLKWFLFWSSENKSIFSAIQSSIFIGAIYGLITANIYRYNINKHKLSRWDELSK